jgi:hypothetical protein
MRSRKGWQREAMSIKAVLRVWRQDQDFNSRSSTNVIGRLE